MIDPKKFAEEQAAHIAGIQKMTGAPPSGPVGPASDWTSDLRRDDERRKALVPPKRAAKLVAKKAREGKEAPWVAMAEPVRMAVAQAFDEFAAMLDEGRGY